MRKCLVLLLVLIIPYTCIASSWGNFRGKNALKESITLDVYNQHNKGDYDDDLTFHVEVKSKAGITEYSQMCHRKAFRDTIWCDGNGDSPIAGTTYKFEREIKDAAWESGGNSEIWRCISGCNQRSPKTLRYDE